MKRFVLYFPGALLVILALGCSSQQVATPQQITNTPTVTALPIPTATPTPHPSAITVENVSSLKLQKVIGAGRVNDVAWSPKGDVIAVAQDFDILFYDSTSLQLLESIGFGGTDVIFSPDGLFLAVAKYGETEDILLSDGISKVVTKDVNIAIWNIEQKAVIQDFKVDMEQVDQILFNADGSYLVIFGNSRHHDPDYLLEVWAVYAGEKVLFERGDAESHVAFSPDGQTLAFVNVAGIALINVETGDEKTIDMAWESGSLAFVNNDLLLKRFDNDRLKLINIKTTDIEKFISVSTDRISEFAISPDKTKLVFPSASSEDYDRRITQVWDLQTESLSYVLDFESSVARIDFSPDSKYFISADDDGYVRIHDLQTGRTVNQMEFNTYIQDVEFVSNDVVAIDYLGGRIDLQDINSNEVVNIVTSYPFGGDTVSVSLDQKFISAKLDEYTGGIWDVESGLLVNKVTCPDKRWIDRILFTENNNSLLIECGGYETKSTVVTFEVILQQHTAVIDGILPVRLPLLHDFGAIQNLENRYGFYVGDNPEIRIVNVRTGDNLFNLKFDKELDYVSLRNISFSSDGKVVALLDSYDSVLVWDTGNSIQKYTFVDHAYGWWNHHRISDIEFSPYGYLLVTAGYDETVRLWDAKTGKRLIVLDGFANDINSIAFSQDGHYLVAGCGDGRVYVWSVE